MRILVKDNLLWKDDTSSIYNILGCFEADKIARANGDMYAERFIGRFAEDTIIELDENLKIKFSPLEP